MCIAICKKMDTVGRFLLQQRVIVGVRNLIERHVQSVWNSPEDAPDAKCDLGITR